MSTPLTPRGGLAVGPASVPSFLRLADVSFERAVDTLRAWESTQHERVVWLDASVKLGRISLDDGIARIAVDMAHPRWRMGRPWSMELELASWSERQASTRWELVPRRHVRVTRRYLESGHRALTILITEARQDAARAPHRGHSSLALAGSLP